MEKSPGIGLAALLVLSVIAAIQSVAVAAELPAAEFGTVCICKCCIQGSCVTVPGASRPVASCGLCSAAECEAQVARIAALPSTSMPDDAGKATSAVATELAVTMPGLRGACVALAQQEFAACAPPQQTQATPAPTKATPKATPTQKPSVKPAGDSPASGEKRAQCPRRRSTVVKALCVDRGGVLQRACCLFFVGFLAVLVAIGIARRFGPTQGIAAKVSAALLLVPDSGLDGDAAEGSVTT